MYYIIKCGTIKTTGNYIMYVLLDEHFAIRYCALKVATVKLFRRIIGTTQSRAKSYGESVVYN